MGKLQVDIPLEIKALKELLDLNVITKEEFDYRKRLLLETPDEKREREDLEKKELIYKNLLENYEVALTLDDFEKLSKEFRKLGDYRDSLQKLSDVLGKVEELQCENAYKEAESRLESEDIKILLQGVSYLEKAGGIKNSEQLFVEYKEKIAHIESLLSDVAKYKATRRKKLIFTFSMLIFIITFTCVLYLKVYVPWKTNDLAYKDAYTLFDNEQYLEASEAFNQISGFKDSSQLSKSALELENQRLLDIYNEAQEYLSSKKYDEAISNFEVLGNYLDSEDKVKEAKYQKAILSYEKKDFDEAIVIFVELGDYLESKDFLSLSNFNKAENLFKDEKYEEALAAYKQAGRHYNDHIAETSYLVGQQKKENKNYLESIKFFNGVPKSSSKFDSAQNEILDSKYQYILSETVPDESKRVYLKELYNNSTYKDRVAKIYEDVFPWRVDIYAVNNSEYSKTNMNSISRLDPIYWHFRISGGDGEDIILKYSTKLPGLDWSSDVFDFAYNLDLNDHGSFFDSWVSTYYTSYGIVTSGTAEVIIYNSATGKELARSSVKVH